MEKRLWEVLRSLFPLGPRKRAMLRRMAPHLTKAELADVRYLVKLGKAGFHEERYGTTLVPDEGWPQLTAATEEKAVMELVARANRKAADGEKLRIFRRFKKGGLARIGALVAPNLEGMERVKEAAAVQLFCTEPVHVLLLGDPGTGKTEILRSMERLAPHALFGLGSGASKAGLVGTHDGKEWQPGLLVEADGGHALIDELNLLKKEDLAGLYSAMEKGFITYDKRGRHERHDARIRVLATANPKGDRFVGSDAAMLKAQLPFEEALLSRFHLLFLVRRPSARELERIARRIARSEVPRIPEGDAALVKDYVAYAERLEVAFDDTHESMVVNFIEELKSRERGLLVEVGPRTVIGVIRLAKGYARARLSRSTNAEDLEQAMRLMKAALFGDDKEKL